ncbi:MAG: formate/nitrite transporter family protein [Alphaproteobacteria bacterium]|nr:formate/nitrite transporter family protein [Alphaproteobacteria bacterium]
MAGDGDDDAPKNISPREGHDIENRARLRARVIYEVVRTEGQEDLDRPPFSLWWSGLAAGLSISFSLLAQAILTQHLPDAPWRHLVASLGYSVGFIIVVLSRQQLFTETTITVVLPLLARFSMRLLGLTGRMWAIVLTANLAGTLVAAAFCTFAPVISPDLRHEMLELSRHAMAHGWWALAFRGVTAGFLIAAMVWLIPSSKGSEFQVVLLLTYLIAVGEFAHIVAGSVEGFMLVLAGEMGLGAMAADFVAPVLLGNITGGTVLFALISYAQVVREM